MYTFIGLSTWRERFLSDFLEECNKTWQISSSLLSLNTEGRPELFLSCRLPASWKCFTSWDIIDFFGTGELRNVSPNSVWQVKWDTRSCLTVSTCCTCEKDIILALRLVKDGWWTGMSRLHHMTGVGSHMVTVVLCVFLIQSKCMKLQPSINILIRVAWLLEHLVFLRRPDIILIIVMHCNLTCHGILRLRNWGSNEIELSVICYWIIKHKVPSRLPNQTRNSFLVLPLIYIHSKVDMYQRVSVYESIVIEILQASCNLLSSEYNIGNMQCNTMHSIRLHVLCL
jgi:hypothetical protein